MVPDQITVPVRPAQYLIGHLHLARIWFRQLPDELAWFLQSMRGELPPSKQAKNYQIHHVYLPKAQYLGALEAITTRLGVKL